MRTARRAAAALRRADSFYRGYARLALFAFTGLGVGGLVLASGLARILLTGAFLLGATLVVFGGSRADSAQQPRDAVMDLAKRESYPQPGTVGTNGPLVTVVVTSHNDARFVSDCLQSVRAQTWASWECVVIDDASTDDTLDAAFNAAGGDERFDIVSLPISRGVSLARNRGVDAAKGEYITFLDADDYLFVCSLENRVTALSQRRSEPGVVGVYCDWVGVPEAGERVPLGRAAIRRDRITWFNATDGAPVINSAPLLITSEVRRIGGYRDSWAEDADLWNRLLRHGYVLDPVLDNGVAYRQKAGSRFRASGPRHSDAMTAIAASNREALDPTERVAGTPYIYEQPVDSYRMTLGRLNRQLIGVVTAHSNDDRIGVSALLDQIAAEWVPHAWLAIDVPETVLSAALRHEAYEDEGRADRAHRTMKAVIEALDERLTPSSWDPMPSTSHLLDPAEPARRLRTRVRAELDVDRLGDVIRDAVVLMPAVRYHLDEMGPLGEELVRRGRKVVFAISDRRWPDVASALRPIEEPIVACPDPGQWVEAAAGYVTLNDWGELYRDIVVEARTRAVPTFAKVEGVQDWEDMDVHWARKAYQTVEHVLCQGHNDQAALDGHSSHIVGSSRLEAIWNQPARLAELDLAVLNSNFTYEVMSDERDRWLDAAVEACEASGITYTISMHPSERPIDRIGVARDPMRHLLTTASVLISRFSTVPFEAMARGVPFIYFNPHGERVPTFHEPHGAFDVAASVLELSDALISAGAWRDKYRERCRAWFLEQVDVETSRTAAERSADVIESICFP